MVHSFKKLDKFFLMDSESGSLFQIDESAYLVARLRYEILSAEEEVAYKALSLNERASIEADFDELCAQNILDSHFSDGVTCVENHGVIKAICLNICHDCNLRCKYCFADEGAYNGERGKMSSATACKSLDFLVKASKTRHNLEVDFFGGEPLMNFNVVKDAVAYAHTLEKQFDKSFHFTITTNAVALKEEDIAFINDNMKNVVLSIDGRKEVHDAVRVTSGGKGSYDIALANSLKLREARGDKEYYVRGTFTARNLDFSKDALALADSGFDQISLEPVVLPQGHELALTEECLSTLKMEYQHLAKVYHDRLRTNKAFNYFHFNIDLSGGPCERKRLTGCGAGVEYVAVACNGELYPCHQFVGDPNYLMGNITDGITRPDISETFCGVNINTKADCRKCWARYYCSGGCNANAVHYSHDLYQPMRLMCELSRERIECALALKAIAVEDDEKS